MTRNLHVFLTIVGAGSLLYSLYAFFMQNFFISEDQSIFLILGILIGIVGIFCLYLGSIPIVFDKMEGFYWTGRTHPKDSLDHSRMKNMSRLDEIHALQIISEYIPAKVSFYSYELNLVLKDGRRLNVVDHNNLSGVRNDATKLGQFLGKPVWDATY